MDNEPIVAPENRTNPREWILRWGLPAAAVGVGMALMGLVSFWWGLIILLLGCCVLAVDCARQMHGASRVLGLLALFVFIAGVCWYAFRPNPLLIDAIVAGAGYEPDTKLAGISWGPNIGDLRVDIRNETDRDYDDLDIQIDTSPFYIMQLAELTGKPIQSHPDAIAPPMYITLKENGTGRTVIVPADPGKHMPWPKYRVRCDKLARKTTLQLVLAIALFNSWKNGPPQQLIGNFLPPRSVTIKGDYRVGQKPVDVDVKQSVDSSAINQPPKP
jgi:hypothetical protein